MRDHADSIKGTFEAFSCLRFHSLDSDTFCSPRVTKCLTPCKKGTRRLVSEFELSEVLSETQPV